MSAKGKEETVELTERDKKFLEVVKRLEAKLLQILKNHGKCDRYRDVESALKRVDKGYFRSRFYKLQGILSVDSGVYAFETGKHLPFYRRLGILSSVVDLSDETNGVLRV